MKVVFLKRMLSRDLKSLAWDFLISNSGNIYLEIEKRIFRFYAVGWVIGVA